MLRETTGKTIEHLRKGAGWTREKLCQKYKILRRNKNE